MKAILWTRNTWARSPQRCAVASVRSYCASKSNNGNKVVAKDDGKSLSHYHDTYQQLNSLDFPTAAKILFTEPPKKKRFGFDFHLVQFFFACMPSLAVYMVAQYARYDMRKMDAELEKKKQEEEAKVKAELEAAKQSEVEATMEIKEVKVRLEKLEESVKEIADVAKQKSSADKKQNTTQEKNNVDAKQKLKTQNEGEPSQDSSTK